MLNKNYERCEKILEKIGIITEMLEGENTDWSKWYWENVRRSLQRKLKLLLEKEQQPWIQVVKVHY